MSPQVPFPTLPGTQICPLPTSLFLIVFKAKKLKRGKVHAFLLKMEAEWLNGKQYSALGTTSLGS